MKTNKATQIALAGTGAVLASTGADADIKGVGVTSERAGEVTVWWMTHNWECKEAAPGWSSYSSKPFPNNFQTLSGSVSIKGTLADGTSYGPYYQEMDASSCDENYVHTVPAFASPTHAGQLCEVDADGNYILLQADWDYPPFDYGIQASLGYDPTDPVLIADGVPKPEEYGGGTEDVFRGAGVVLCNSDLFPAEEDGAWQGATIRGLGPGEYTVTYLECNNENNIDSDCLSRGWTKDDWHPAMLLSMEIDVRETWDGDNLPDDDNPGFQIPRAAPSTPVPVMGWLGSLALALITAVAAGLRLRRRAQA